MEKEILFSYFPKNTVRRYRQLMSEFKNLDNAWQAEFDDLKRLNWSDNLIHEFLLWKDELDENKIFDTLRKEKIKCLTISNDKYPKLLKEIYDPPFCLFVRGEFKAFKLPIAIVGTRKNTNYGKNITKKLASTLTQAGCEIISGLAYGIDAVSHDTCINKSGYTIAVLGGGIDKQHVHPAGNKILGEKIIQNGGCLISEYPPGTLPTKFTFPKRNRIIAGLSKAVIIIEAPKKSGALITAQSALDNNRDIYAIPQNIDSHTSSGVNKLIKSGAGIITEANDILEYLNLPNEDNCDNNNRTIKPDNLEEEKILDAFDNDLILHIDDIIKKTAMESSLVSSTISIMELKGAVKNIGNMKYKITS
ncbi:MAG: DNA-protecting protein DprA [Candidatus Magasanikbacteria bacterium]|nr:DNA-protecting protein DprA [Candidatus Magasanikbacteria bacterium]